MEMNKLEVGNETVLYEIDGDATFIAGYERGNRIDPIRNSQKNAVIRAVEEETKKYAEIQQTRSPDPVPVNI